MSASVSPVASVPSLLELARSGDTDAFDQVIRTHLEMVFRLSLAILGDEADARDAVQETFVSAWRNISRLRDLSRFEPWLRQICANACRTVIRQRRRRRLLEPRLGAYVSSGGGTPDLDLTMAFERLGVDKRFLLARHYLFGASIEELATELGIATGTVKSRLFAARRALAKALEEQG